MCLEPSCTTDSPGGRLKKKISFPTLGLLIFRVGTVTKQLPFSGEEVRHFENHVGRVVHITDGHLERQQNEARSQL